MKKTYIVFLAAGVAVIAVLAGVLIFGKAPAQNKTATQPSQFAPVQAPETKGGLEVTSPCTGASKLVCGEDGQTYASQCLADFLGVKVKSEGMCPFQSSQK